MNSRQIKFLKLLQQQNDYKPASFYAKWLSVSTKTIYSDINAVYELLSKNNLILDSSPRNGIKIIGDSNIIDEILKEIYDEEKEDIFLPINRRYQIIKLVLLENKNLTLDDLSETFLVSKTSIYQDLGNINKIFSLQNVKLKITTNGILVEGLEIDIQTSIKNYIFENTTDGSLLDLKNKISKIFDKSDIELIFNLLLEDYSELTHDVSIYYMKSIIAVLLIQISRLRYNHHVEPEETFMFNNIRFMETYIVANSIVEYLQQNLNVRFNNFDVEYLCRQLFAHRITTSLKTNNNEYSSFVKEIIDAMSKIEKIDLSHDEHLYKSLIYHVPAMILRLKKGIQITNPLLESIKKQYSELFSIVWYALSIIESRYNVLLNDDEVSLILIHFQLALDRISKANNILIVCPYGLSSSQLILSKIKQLLPSKDNIELSNIEKLYTTDLSNVDFIITSVELEKIDVPFVKVNPIVTNEDYIKIMNTYSKYILFKKEIMKELEHFRSPTLSKFINPTLISIRKDYKSKKECLDALITELEKRCYVSKKFRESILNREKAGVTC